MARTHIIGFLFNQQRWIKCELREIRVTMFITEIIIQLCDTLRLPCETKYSTNCLSRAVWKISGEFSFLLLCLLNFEHVEFRYLYFFEFYTHFTYCGTYDVRRMENNFKTDISFVDSPDIFLHLIHRKSSSSIWRLSQLTYGLFRRTGRLRNYNMRRWEKHS